MGNPQKELLRSKGYIPALEAAKRTGTTVSTVYYWIEKGYVEGARIGSRWYVQYKSLCAYFQKKDPKAAALLGLTSI